MDGIWILLLILFLVSALKKKKQGKKAHHGPETARHRAERSRKLQEEAQARMAGKRQTAFMQEHEPLAEGQSHTVPGEGVATYMGSLHETSAEGEDLCDPMLAHDRSTPVAPESVYAGEIGREAVLDFSPRGLYQGIVMSEILTRPAQRARRYR